MNISKAVEKEIFHLISKGAQELGVEAYVIGGYVRDFLLERPHKKDIDIVSNVEGILLAQAVAKKLSSNLKVVVFKRFGTAHFHWKGTDYEFVAARKESYANHSRKPEVEQGTLEDDQNRRDFTVNAMAISLSKDNFGELIDPFDGRKHLSNKILKTPLNPEITYKDDPLRMMRAARFATQLNFDIDEPSILAIQKQAKRLEIVSQERIMDEFQKIMECPKPSIGLKWLDRLKLLPIILPELMALKGVEEVKGQTHKDNFYHTLEVTDNLAQRSSNVWLRWAALLHDIGKAPTKKFDPQNGWTFHSHEFVGAKMVEKIFRRLKLPLGEPKKYVKKMVMLSSRPIALVGNEATDSAMRRLLVDAGNDLDDLFLLCKSDITTKNEEKKLNFQRNFDKVEQKIRSVEERDQVKNFQPPISGETIMKTFDISPGVEVGEIKNAIKEAILEGNIKNDPKEAFSLMINLGKDLNLTPKISIDDL